MGLTDYLGKKRRLMIVKEVEFGVYLGNKDDKVLLPKKQVPKDVEVGDPVEVFLYKDSSDRLIATTQEPKGEYWNPHFPPAISIGMILWFSLAG